MLISQSQRKKEEDEICMTSTSTAFNSCRCIMQLPGWPSDLASVECMCRARRMQIQEALDASRAKSE